MSAYVILDIEVHNQEMYAQYVERAGSIIEKAGGRYLVRGGKVTQLSGTWRPKRLVVIEFKTVEQARQCFASAEYLHIAPLREQATTSHALIVEGYAPSP